MRNIISLNEKNTVRLSVFLFIVFGFFISLSIALLFNIEPNTTSYYISISRLSIELVLGFTLLLACWIYTVNIKIEWQRVGNEKKDLTTTSTKTKIVQIENSSDFKVDTSSGKLENQV